MGTMKFSPDGKKNIAYKLTDEAFNFCLDIGINVYQYDLSEERNTRITGTDLPYLLDIETKYGSKNEVIAKKIGLIEDNFVPTDQTQLGLFLEPFLLSRALFSIKDKLIAFGKSHALLYVTMGEFMTASDEFGCSMDAIVWVNEEPMWAFEFKTTSGNWGSGLPLRVHAQVQGQMMCNGLDMTTVLFIDNTHRVQTEEIYRDPEWSKVINEQVDWAWEWIQRKEVPPVEPYPEPIKVPKVKGKKPVVKATEDQARIAEVAKAYDLEIKDLEAKIEALSEKKKAECEKLAGTINLGECLELPNGKKFDFRTQVFGTGISSGSMLEQVKPYLLQFANETGKGEDATRIWEELEKTYTNRGVQKNVFTLN